LSPAASCSPCAARFGSYWLVVFATATVRRAVGYCSMAVTAVHCCSVAATTHHCGVGASIACISASAVSSAGNVPSSSTTSEAITAPAVAVAPIRPGAHAQENAAMEIAWTIKAAGCASVRCIVVVAVGTDGRSCPDAHDNLRAGHWPQGQGHEQGCCAGQKQTTPYELASPGGHALDLPHWLLSSKIFASNIESYAFSIIALFLDSWSIRTVFWEYLFGISSESGRNRREDADFNRQRMSAMGWLKRELIARDGRRRTEHSSTKHCSTSNIPDAPGAVILPLHAMNASPYEGFTHEQGR